MGERRTGSVAGYSAGATGVGLFAMDRLLDHGELGVLVFGILALAALFFGWLSARGRS